MHDKQFSIVFLRFCLSIASARINKVPATVRVSGVPEGGGSFFVPGTAGACIFVFPYNIFMTLNGLLYQVTNFTRIP